MKIFVDFHSLKWGPAIWLVLYLSSLLILWLKRKQWKEGYDLFFWLAVGGILVVYCPLTYKLLVPGFLPGFGEYERLGYVFYVMPILAYTMTALTREQPTRRRRTLFVAALAALLLTVGHLYNWQWFVKPENPYKISQESVDVVQVIREDAGDIHLFVTMQLNSSLRRKSDQYEDYLLYYGIRQYEAQIHLLKCVVPPDTYDDPGFTLTGKLKRYSDYYVGAKGVDCVTSELERAGYVPIGETEHYRILRNQKRYDKKHDAGKESP